MQKEHAAETRSTNWQVDWHNRSTRLAAAHVSPDSCRGWQLGREYVRQPRDEHQRTVWRELGRSFARPRTAFACGEASEKLLLITAGHFM